MRSSRVGRRPARSQWKVGRLEDRIRDLALDLIVIGEDLARFEHDRRLHERRAKILIEFEAELRSPQRTPSRIKKTFRSMSPVGVGDVFWVALPEGRRALLRCVAISGDERDKSPTVEVLDWVPPDDPHDTGALRARPPVPYPNGSRKPDLLWLVRYPRDPDFAAHVTVIATGTPVTRQRTLPATMTAWADLPARLAEDFGL